MRPPLPKIYLLTFRLVHPISCIRDFPPSKELVMRRAAVQFGTAAFWGTSALFWALAEGFSIFPPPRLSSFET